MKKGDFKRIVLLLVVIGLFFRVFGLDMIMYDGEADLSNKLYYTSSDTFWHVPHHPFIPISLYSASSFVFGHNTIAYRLVPFLFSIANLFMVYLIAKKFFGEKSALYSSLLMAFSFAAVLGAIKVDYIACIQMFFFLLFFYFYLGMFSSRGLRKYAILGAIAGLAFLTVHTSVLIFFISGLYSLIVSRKFWWSVRENAIIFGIALIVYMIFPIVSLLTNPFILERAIRSASIFNFFVPNYKLVPVVLVLFGPLLLGLFLVNILKHNEWPKENIAFVLWAVIPFCLYFFTKHYIMVERYMLIAIAPMCIMGGFALSKTKFKKMGIAMMAFIVSLFIMFILNANVQYIPHNIGDYISRAAAFDWGFYLPITGRTGPTFGIAFSSIAFAFIASFVFLGVSLLMKIKKSRLAGTFFVIFLAVAFSYDIYVSQEFIFNTVHPDVTDVSYKSIEFFKEIGGEKPLYSTNNALWIYLDVQEEDYIPLYGGYAVLGETDTDFINSSIHSKGGTALLINYPFISKEGDVFKTMQQCSLAETFYSKGMEMAYVFDCSEMP